MHFGLTIMIRRGRGLAIPTLIGRSPSCRTTNISMILSVLSTSPGMMTKRMLLLTPEVTLSCGMIRCALTRNRLGTRRRRLMLRRSLARPSDSRVSVRSDLLSKEALGSGRVKESVCSRRGAFRRKATPRVFPCRPFHRSSGREVKENPRGSLSAHRKARAKVALRVSLKATRKAESERDTTKVRGKVRSRTALRLSVPFTPVLRTACSTRTT